MPITIDADLCKSDELCVRDCPTAVLKIVEKGLPPIVNPNKANFCINCGHCASICPTNAITLSAFPAQKSTSFISEDIADYSSFETLLKSRRSIRQFKKKQLTIDEITELIHIAAYAPSGHNAQPVSWTVLNQPEKVQELGSLVAGWMEEFAASKNPIAEKLFLSGIAKAFKNGNDIICRDAPALAVSWAPKVGITPSVDAIIAATHMELAAHAKNLGACWAGYIILAAAYSEQIRTFLGITKENSIHGALLLGHPSVKYKNTPPRHRAKPIKTDKGFIFPARKHKHS